MALGEVVPVGLEYAPPSRGRIKRSVVREGGPDAGQELERQEREAVRSAEGQGNVQGARREDLELPGRVEPWREEVGFVVELVQLVEAGRYDGTEEGSRPQGRQGRREEVLT